ncbi:unnamed protein product, partial [Symbiodinium pilosum]
LAAQAAERLDGLRVNGAAWCELSDQISIMRLWLSVLCRVARRLGHGCFLAELLGAPGVSGAPAAEDLISVFCATLAAAARAVAGRAPTARECAKLEAQLQASQQKLLSALWRRPLRTGEVAAEVLALSAAHSVLALLADAAKCLALSVEIALVQEVEDVDAAEHKDCEASELHASELPDLTE